MKPLALDPAESDRLGRLAADTGLVLQVGFWRRFSPPWRAARDAIAAGSIGRPVLIRLSQWDADPPPPEFCDPAVSGGLAVDCGVHEFDLVEWLSSTPLVEVRGETLPVVECRVGEGGDVDNLLVVGTLRRRHSPPRSAATRSTCGTRFASSRALRAALAATRSLETGVFEPL